LRTWRKPCTHPVSVLPRRGWTCTSDRDRHIGSARRFRADKPVIEESRGVWISRRLPVRAGDIRKVQRRVKVGALDRDGGRSRSKRTGCSRCVFSTRWTICRARSSSISVPLEAEPHPGQAQSKRSSSGGHCELTGTG
jgi:hypothetical protein